MNALRTAFAARGAHPEPAEQGEGLQADSVPAEDTTPAWRLLGAQTGVQDLAHADIARPGVQRLFRRPPRRLLDIGCASGAVAAGLKLSMPRLWAWGCELNEAAAQVAATRLDHVTRVPRAQWNADDLARVASVDTVLLLDVLEHMYNPWAELEFLARHLPADAQVIVSLPNVGHIDVLGDLSLGSFPYRATGILDVSHVRFFTFDDMLAMFDQTGFEVEETWVLNHSSNVRIENFPARVAAGKLEIVVDSAEEWERLNAIQFGFRLHARR
jgi:2-polyprenyl-3-methyl-5-hydroxy-6-metoxy-1,4-benzoquinol methylase